MRPCIDSHVSPLAFAEVISIEDLSARLGSENDSDCFVDPAPFPDALIERRQAVDAVGAFIKTLSTREREIVRRIFWDDETQTTVAADFGTSKMAICKAVARISREGKKTLAAHQHIAFIN